MAKWKSDDFGWIGGKLYFTFAVLLFYASFPANHSPYEVQNVYQAHFKLSCFPWGCSFHYASGWDGEEGLPWMDAICMKTFSI